MLPLSEIINFEEICNEIYSLKLNGLLNIIFLLFLILLFSSLSLNLGWVDTKIGILNFFSRLVKILQNSLSISLLPIFSSL